MTETEDILQNLTWILRTRRGTGYFRTDFGLSEPSYRTSAELVEAMSREIRETVAKYEPRVAVDAIEAVFDDENVCKSVQVSLRILHGGARLQFDVDPATNRVEPGLAGEQAKEG